MRTEQIGACMKRQRGALTLESERVAELAQIAHERLLELEAGAAPTVWELHSVAAALAVEPRALRSGELESDPRRSGARFRAPDGVRHLSAEDVRTLARAAEAARVHSFLRNSLSLPRGRVEVLRQVAAIDPMREPWRQGYSLGQHARERLAPRHTPIESMQRLLEELGVLVVCVDLESPTIEGASLYEQEASPAIILNGRSSRVASRLARRAVLAHELCHLLHDSTKREDLLTVVSRPNDRSATEQRANGFAPSFLAPGHWVERHRRMRPPDKVKRIAEAWGLTFGGAVWHAKNLKHITSTTADALQRERVRVEAGSFERDLERLPPSRVGLDVAVSRLADSSLGDLAVRACEAELITVGRTEEILTMR